MAFFLSSLNWKSQPKGISGVKTNLRRFNRKMSNEEIKFDALNYRTHDEKNLKLIKKSLKELGAGRSIVIDSEGEIIAGNATYKQARELGLPVQVVETDGKRLIVVKRTDLKTQDKKRKRLALMDNSTSDKVQWDFDHIAADFDLEELPDWGIEDLPNTSPVQAIEEDDAPEVSETTPRAKKGDIWQLGSHRLMCGDSTSITDVEKLMDGAKADMVFTDPPYGMNLDTDYSKMRGNEGCGKKYDKGYVDAFNPKILETIFKFFYDTEEIFLFGADYYSEFLENKNEGSWIVWDKRENENTGKNVDNRFGSMFELCWSKKKHKREIFRYMWAGMMRQKDIDNIRFHPTQKPCNLIKIFIEKYGSKVNNVVDLFGGSGSTLIACEKLDRKCYMMELDPHYCDVIITRWETLTGKQARLLEA